MQAWDRVEPFGDQRSDLQAGIVAATVANSNRTSRNARGYSALDFMPYAEKPPIKQLSNDEIARRLRSWCKAHGGTIKHGDNRKPRRRHHR